MEAYAGHVHAAAMKLIRVLALSLDLEEDFFLRHYRKPVFTTRVIHYPVPDERFGADYDIGALAHTDYGHITVLAQDPSGGLEIRLPSGEWVSAPVIDGTFVVNLGDLMQRWSNDTYRSTHHRVVNRLGRDRISIPTFVYPDFRTLISCIPTCVSADRPAKYEPVLAGDYVADMLRKTQGFRTPAQAGA
jgi:isopenicillin N synthase-like dioxygenase